MSLRTITRKLEWDAGHRVLNHGSKCRHLHGHRFVAEVTVAAPELDDLGMVIDFSVLKRVIGGWIDREWDHNMMLHPDDPLLKAVVCTGDVVVESEDPEPIWGGKALYVMKSGNPTAENIACELFHKATDLLTGTGITVLRVRIAETPNCWAEYSSPSASS